MNKLYKTFSSLIKITVYIFLILNIVSCGTTKYFKENEQLLEKNEVVFSKETKDIDDPGFETYEIEDLIRPKENTKLFGMKIYLRLYNLYSPEKIKNKEAKSKEKCKQKRDKKVDKYNSKEIKNLEYWRNQNEKGSEEYIKYDKKLKAKQNKRNQIQQKTCDKKHWTQSSGEAPVLYNMNDEFRNVRQIRIFLKNKGYYNAKVKSEKIKTGKNKVKVIYEVEPNTPYRINNIEYFFEDTTLRDIVLKDTASSIIKKGSRIDIELLDNYRNNIASLLRNNGYYKFTKEYIYYSIDSTFSNFSADLLINIGKAKDINEQKINHKKYYIKNVYIYPNFNPKKALSEKEKYFSQFDTLNYLPGSKYKIIFDKPMQINTKALLRGIYISPDSLYKLSEVKDSYKYLSSLKIIKIANINFTENVEKNETDSIPRNKDTEFLDCNIKLTQNMLQSYTIEVEGTNTSGNVGMAGSMTYSHRNIFKNAEVFDLHFKGALERQGSYSKTSETEAFENTGFFNSRELGMDISFKFPRMLAPIQLKKIIKKFNPQTSITANYNFLNRPDYTRTIAGINYGYTWNSSQSISHVFKPVLLDLVKIKDPTIEFLEYINKLHLNESYENHFILGTSYSIIINNQINKTGNNFTYLRITGKSAGNLLSGIMSLSNMEKQDGSYKILDNTYAQFIKADIDFRFYRKLSRANDKIVFRTFIGIALPYGNLNVIPFGEKYFSGGANGVRAWQVRALGPGTYSLPVNTDVFPNQTSDIKLEGNLEYRLKLFWMVEGAFFIDAGNIWAINSNDDRTGALFEINKFYNEIAVGTGFGFRFDFDFFIIRFDLGLKLKDPASPSGSRWIPLNRSFNSNDWTFNIGIGYPF